MPLSSYWGLPGSSGGKKSACSAGDPSSISEPGRSTGEGIGYPQQYSWASLVAQLVKKPPAMWETWFDPWIGKILQWRERLPTRVFWLVRIPWNSWGIVLGVTKSWTQLSNFHFPSYLAFLTLLDKWVFLDSLALRNFTILRGNFKFQSIHTHRKDISL